MAPRSNSAGAAASFARHFVRQSGGAGSGGKPDKAGAAFCYLVMISGKSARRKGYKSGVPTLYRLFGEDYRTACCSIARVFYWRADSVGRRICIPYFL
jgi:hypothetical protein